MVALPDIETVHIEYRSCKLYCNGQMRSVISEKPGWKAKYVCHERERPSLSPSGSTRKLCLLYKKRQLDRV